MSQEQSHQDPMMPSDVTGEIGFFDRFAGGASKAASRAPFFAFCVLLIVVWVPSISFLKVDTWQLIINTATTIIAFLLVALLQNSQTRNDQATQHKLNAIADGLADLMIRVANRYEDDDLHREVKELKLAVGLEGREGTAHTQEGSHGQGGGPQPGRVAQPGWVAEPEGPRGGRPDAVATLRRVASVGRCGGPIPRNVPYGGGGSSV